ncbi:unnamed protein product [Arctia plantaginis]|uniref:Uncharacterized protein n=1 Tax=Arctia plantaginis TaxID=874455 RepID=A0A8S1BDW2_ARCPL|nr:unnamed protein product [Arctia plantaginis]
MYSDVDGLGTVGCVCASRRILAKRSAQHSGRGGASRALRRPCDGCVSAAHVRTSLAPEPAQAVNNGLRQAEARSADSPPVMSAIQCLPRCAAPPAHRSRTATHNTSLVPTAESLIMMWTCA